MIPAITGLTTPINYFVGNIEYFEDFDLQYENIISLSSQGPKFLVFFLKYLLNSILGFDEFVKRRFSTFYETIRVYHEYKEDKAKKYIYLNISLS